MKTLLVLALVALIASCHFDKLFTAGGGTQLSHDPPAGLAFATRPGPAHAGQPLNPVLVTVIDAAGTRVAGADTLITVALGANPSGAALTGTSSAHAVNGVARFADLTIDKEGKGYTLTATVVGLTPDTSAAFDVMPPPPTTGYVTVTTSTTGATPDPDGYAVAVDAGASQPIGNVDTVTISGVAPGSHAVALTGLAPNCSATGGASRNATVVAGDTARVAFAVTCPTPPATTGSVRVTTSTTGASPDVDGYSVAVDNGTSQHIDPNNSTGVTFTDLPVGSHTAVLSGVAANCTVTGGNSKTVNVTAGNTAIAAFDISCPTPPPTTGDLTVTTTTGGTGTLDPNGYIVTVDGAQKAIATNGSVPFTGLTPGNHSVSLSDVATNCAVNGQNPQTVAVVAGNTAHADFAITCSPPPNQPPTAAFTPSCNFLDCSFTSTSSDPDGTITSQQWNFGDGTTGSGASPTHHYNAANTYRVTLTVTDNGGLTDVLSKDVVVTQPPAFNQPPVVIAGSDQHPLVGLVFNLDGASFSDPDHDGPWTVTIDWGDGSQPLTFSASEGPINGSHSYTGVALTEYTLTVTVVDAHGNRNSDSKKVTVALL